MCSSDLISRSTLSSSSWSTARASSSVPQVAARPRQLTHRVQHRASLRAQLLDHVRVVVRQDPVVHLRPPPPRLDPNGRLRHGGCRTPVPRLARRAHLAAGSSRPSERFQRCALTTKGCARTSCFARCSTRCMRRTMTTRATRDCPGSASSATSAAARSCGTFSQVTRSRMALETLAHTLIRSQD